MFFAGLIGMAIGALTIPLAQPRGKMSPVLPPAIGGAVGLVYWIIATWLTQVPGFGFLAYDAMWIWIGLVVIVAVVCIIVTRTLPGKRAQDDKDLLDRLSHVGRAEL